MILILFYGYDLLGSHLHTMQTQSNFLDNSLHLILFFPLQVRKPFIHQLSLSTSVFLIGQTLPLNCHEGRISAFLD
jgi:hypothetical protein